MASIATVLRKDKLNKKGKAPIHFRIIKHRKTRYISSSVFIEPKYWDSKKEKVKSNHPNSNRLNSFLSNKFTELQDQVFEHETISKSLSTSQLKDKIMGKQPSCFWTVAENALKQYWAEGKVGTHDKNKAVLNKLKGYVGDKPLYFQNIDVTFLIKYEKYLREVHQNSTNTINKDLKFIRKIFNDAIRIDIIDVNINPFIKYKLKTVKTERTYLTEDELMQLIMFEPTPYTRIDLHRDMFVFSAYAGGLRVSDVLKLEKVNFDGQHIHVTIQKTKGQLSIKLPNKALQIIEKWAAAPNASQRFIFPALPDTIKLNDPVELDKEISSKTAYTNKNLKIIAKKVGIEKKISFHISRHTWATRALRKGISIDKVSKLMGHAAIRETQIYAKIVNEELDKAMDIFND
ncbi:MAG: site-specific integrase [Bacteroidota bacterium]